MAGCGEDLPERVAFVATRIAGTDGVSLETRKWAEVLRRLGVECSYVAGELDADLAPAVRIPEAHFAHPRIRAIAEQAFDVEVRTRALTDEIFALARELRDRIGEEVEGLGADWMVIENALTIPMNLPLGVGLVQFLQERAIPTIAHHHDFYWERRRFIVNAVDDILAYAFPPPLVQLRHVVINSVAAERFSRRTGMCPRVIPNVMDFANPPAGPNHFAARFREELGIRGDQLLVLQPTRVVARKGIEHSIELVRHLGVERARLVITHASGDEGDAYARRIRDFADTMGVEPIFADDKIGAVRGTTAEGGARFSVADAYGAADIVAYPSAYEGFGNAFLEAVYYRKPIVCNRYAIYRTDIEPCGFRVILFDGFLTGETVREVERVAGDGGLRDEMVGHNYEIGERHFSYEVLERELVALLRGLGGTKACAVGARAAHPPAGD